MIDINTWWAAAQAHPYMAVTQAVGCLTIAMPYSQVKLLINKHLSHL